MGKYDLDMDKKKELFIKWNVALLDFTRGFFPVFCRDKGPQASSIVRKFTFLSFICILKNGLG